MASDVNGACRHTGGRRGFLGGVFLLPALTLSAVPSVGPRAREPGGLDPIVQPSEQTAARYIERAQALAALSLSRGDGTGYGAVVVKAGLIVGEGRNRTVATNDPTAHSEIDAIRDACLRLNVRTLQGCEIYCSARPCQMCGTACYWAKLDRIHYAGAGSDIISADPRYARC